MKTPVLELDNVTMRFGGVVALREANITVNSGEIFALIGPNGAGKTTVFNVVTGVYAPTEGQVVSIQPVFSGFWGAHYAGAGRVRAA